MASADVALRLLAHLRATRQGHGRFELEVVARQSGGKAVEDFVLTGAMPKTVNSASLTPSVGSWSFDQVLPSC